MAKVLVNRLYDDIENAINDIFIKYQNELKINSGDVTPGLAIKLSESIESVAEYMEEILAYQEK